MSFGSCGSLNKTEDDVLHEVVFIKRDYDHNEDPEAINIRTNLNELAFFMPQLRTDDKGIATLAFTLPESVTTWKFMALAHDKELKSVTRIDKVIAQKKLMIHIKSLLINQYLYIHL